MKLSTILGFTVPFDGTGTAEFAKHTIEAFAQGSVRMAHLWKLPPLYQSGVRFQYERNHGEGIEEFCLPDQTFKQRWGDCDDLCIYRIWELRVGGELATCNAIWDHNAVHVRVRRADGRIEDPSTILGAR